MGDLNINNYIIHNSPDYANDYPFIVATELDDELWFYGAYEDRQKAFDAEFKVGGILIRNFKRCSKCSHFSYLDTNIYECDYSNCCDGEPDNRSCGVFKEAVLEK